MASNPGSNGDPPDEGEPHLAAALGRKAARFVKAARPGFERLVAQAKPGIEKAGRDALQYAREHEDELKSHAVRLARTRVTGPLGLVVDAVAHQAQKREEAPPALACAHCQNVNPPAARFCNQCGQPLAAP